MLKINKKKKNRISVLYLSLAGFMFISSLLCITSPGFTQDLSEEEHRAAIIQYTLKYRFGKDLKVGDWVTYKESTDESGNAQEFELKVTGEERGNSWIEEKFQGSEIQYLVDLKQMKLMKLTGTEEDGSKFEITPMSDERLAEIMEMFKTRMAQQGSFAQFVAWEKGGEKEKVDSPAGSFTCDYIKPVYAEEYANQVNNYVNLLKQQGKSEAEINAAVYGNEPRLYFSNDVPKMLPAQIAIGWMPWIDIFEGLTGGLVECRHMSPISLTGYSR